MSGVLEKILEADVIIWSFLLYYFSLPAPLKALMDRMLPTLQPFLVRGADGADSGAHPSRYDMSGKRFVLISTCGFHTAAGNYDAVEFQFDRLYGRERCTKVFCGQGELFRVEQLRECTDAWLGHVETAGREFAQGGIMPQTCEKLRQPLLPREVFEQMANTYWNELLKKA